MISIHSTTSVNYGQGRSSKLFSLFEWRYTRQPSQCGRLVQRRLNQMYKILQMSTVVVYTITCYSKVFFIIDSFRLLGAEFRRKRPALLQTSSVLFRSWSIFLKFLPEATPPILWTACTPLLHPQPQVRSVLIRNVSSSIQLHRERWYHWCIQLAS